MKVSDLSASYGRRHQVLRKVSLEITEGELVGLAGPNGSGKTTLLHCITGYHAPDGGLVELRQMAVSSMSRRAVAEQVAFVPQHTETVFSYTVLQMVLMGRHPYSGFAASDSAADTAIAMEALEKLHIAGLAGRVFAKLSGGEKQLVLLARALAQQVPLLVLDEPLTGLDIRHQFQLMSAIRDISNGPGRGALATFHDLSVAARWCDRLILLHEGEILAAGRPADVITTENLEKLFGVYATVLAHDRDESLFISVVDCKSSD